MNPEPMNTVDAKLAQAGVHGFLPGLDPGIARE
jgi:hypothetical protein